MKDLRDPTSKMRRRVWEESGEDGEGRGQGREG